MEIMTNSKDMEVTIYSKEEEVMEIEIMATKNKN